MSGKRFQMKATGLPGYDRWTTRYLYDDRTFSGQYGAYGVFEGGTQHLLFSHLDLYTADRVVECLNQEASLEEKVDYRLYVIHTRADQYGIRREGRHLDALPPMKRDRAVEVIQFLEAL